MTVQLLLLAVAIALEPLPLASYIVLLSQPRGTRNGAGFIAGWLVTLAVIAVGVLALTGGEPLSRGSAPSTAVLIVQIGLGVLLLWLAWWQHLRPEKPAPPPDDAQSSEPPARRVGFVASFVLGFVMQPWPLVAAGAAAIASADIGDPLTVVTLIVFGLISTASYLTMQAYVLISPEPARRRLDALRLALERRRRRVVIVVALVVGLWLILHSGFLLLT